MRRQWNERTCQAKLPVAAFQGLLDSNCSYVERIVTRGFVKVGYMNTEWNFLISPVMLRAHCVSFERRISQPLHPLDGFVLVHLDWWNTVVVWCSHWLIMWLSDATPTWGHLCHLKWWHERFELKVLKVFRITLEEKLFFTGQNLVVIS